ncbi:ABC transporter substrate-binding protein [Marinivivus vitaminiproducens]|uniref:ABC transporter substrate-binding protein n=1 Tax=Marinivivus vitaminiproducens TaxID=3035935 RepID=UPI0027AA80EA|nr:ABC transporter substrate-binding protein [Geminicoccaceae bacterium SCSIO 64248]
MLGAVMLFGVNDAALAQDNLQVRIGYITQQLPEPLPLSLAVPVLTDNGVMGARVGREDNATTGRFLKQDYELVEIVVPENGDVRQAFADALGQGIALFAVDLPADSLLTLAGEPEAAGALLFNVRAEDDRLRAETCLPNVFHTAPSRAMKADALAQYLVWKRWTRWFLLTGTRPEDVAFADAMRRAAERFGAEIVEDRPYTYEAGSRRTDTGHVQVQSQMPVATQNAAEHDVLVVADENEVFGEYVPYRTWDARPVVGTQGLFPATWNRNHEQWGGTQMQSRFESFAKRAMTERDYNAWIAVRAIGEAVTRTSSADPKALKAFLLGDQFGLGAFKGQALTFRRWNHQIREPILLTTARSLVSVSPQDGFLHQRTPLDTLGYDEPDSTCRLD